MEPSAIDVGGFALHVRSVAGVESACYVDAVDAAFDIGLCFGKIVSKSHVFVTHGHIDHIGAFVTHAAQRSLLGMPPARYYVPPHLIPHMQSILDGFSAMQETPIAAKILPIEPLEEVHISAKWMVKSFPTCHRVPSCGYILYSKRNKLRPDLVGRSGQEIAALKNAGEDVTSTESIPELAYTGDTTVETFTNAIHHGFSDLLRVKVLVTEATYVDNRMTGHDATARGHIHLQQIIQLEHLFSDIQALVLVHSSARYGSNEVRDLILDQLPPSLKAKTIVGGRR